MSDVRSLIVVVTPANPASSRWGSDSANSAATSDRSGTATGSSSPAIDVSRSALRMPSFDENSRYTVAGGTSARALIASMVVAVYPPATKRSRAASITARRASRVRA